MAINYNIRTNYKFCHLDSNKTETLTIKLGCYKYGSWFGLETYLGICWFEILFMVHSHVQAFKPDVFDSNAAHSLHPYMT